MLNARTSSQNEINEKSNSKQKRTELTEIKFSVLTPKALSHASLPRKRSGQDPIVRLTNPESFRVLNSPDGFSISNIPFLEIAPCLRSNPEVNSAFSAR